MKKILIFGACSAIASEAAICFAKEGALLYLVDLNLGRLEAVRDNINTRYPTEIKLDVLNALDFDKHKEMFDRAVEAMGGLDAILIAHGTLPDQENIQKNTELIIKEFNINCVSIIHLASVAANYFEEKKSGCIAAISSVAGDRGRQSNYVYGAAKGGVSLFMQGLRNRLAKSGVSVLTIKPGFVDTPMTAHLQKNALYSSPQKIGQLIFEAMTTGKDIVYTPGFWRLIMFIIKHIPESIFKKLSL